MSQPNVAAAGLVWEGRAYCPFLGAGTEAGRLNRLEARVKRFLLALVPFALVLSACATGEPLPPTDPTSTSITLHAKVYSSIDGPTEYWFAYGAPGDEPHWMATSRQTVQISGRGPHPVSRPLTRLDPDSVYGWKVCVADQEEDPPREVCSKRQQFATVGDSITGGGTVPLPPPLSPSAISFNVLSGPNGQNPAGSVVTGLGGILTYQVTCLRVDGVHATIGLTGGFHTAFMQLDAPLSGNATFEEEDLNGRDPADCPVPNAHNGELEIIGSVIIRDAP
jgi:hypothetical protein